MLPCATFGIAGGSRDPSGAEKRDPVRPYLPGVDPRSPLYTSSTRLTLALQDVPVRGFGGHLMLADIPLPSPVLHFWQSRTNLHRARVGAAEFYARAFAQFLSSAFQPALS